MKKRTGNKSVMTHQFSQVPKADIPRSSFDRSHGVKTTLNSGLLVPIICDEVLPGDSVSLKFNAFSRLATPLKPVMDNMFMDTFFFFVPNRLLWDNWERFNGAQDNPTDSTDFTVPVVNISQAGVDPESLYDYMGIPPGPVGFTPNALHMRAYNLIWNQWFRSETLQDSVIVNTDDGPDPQLDYTVLRRGKRFDYFSSALPYPQKGDPVTLNLGTSAPVVPTQPQVFASGPSFQDFANNDLGRFELNSNDRIVKTENQAAGISSALWLDPDLTADLSQATAITVNAMREAFQVQKLLERDARGGTRYIELLKSHFGVTSPDSRLQRPELLSTSSQPINVTPIAQTTPSDVSAVAESPQGNLAAIGTSIAHNGFTKSFVEHGVIIGLVSVRADLSYQQGLDRMWSRQTRFDYYWPVFSHLGEQAILNKEIFLQGPSVVDPDTNPVDDNVFGYQESWAEYRYKNSLITGKFRSSDPQSLDFWHLSQDFANLPVLNDEFIQDTPPIQRIIAVPGEPEFLFDGYFSMRSARPMPMYGVPGLIDHF